MNQYLDDYIKLQQKDFNDGLKLMDNTILEEEKQINYRSQLGNNGVFTLINLEEHIKNVKNRKNCDKNVISRTNYKLDSDFFEYNKNDWCPVFENCLNKLIIQEINVFKSQNDIDIISFNDKIINEILNSAFKCFNFVPSDIKKNIYNDVLTLKHNNLPSLINQTQFLHLIKWACEKLQFGRIKTKILNKEQYALYNYSNDKGHNPSNFNIYFKNYEETFDNKYLYDMYQIIINMYVDNSSTCVILLNDSLGCIDLPDGKYLMVYLDERQIPVIYKKFVSKISIKQIIEKYYEFNKKQNCNGLVINYSPLSAKGLKLTKEILNKLTNIV